MRESTPSSVYTTRTLQVDRLSDRPLPRLIRPEPQPCRHKHPVLDLHPAQQPQPNVHQRRPVPTHIPVPVCGLKHNLRRRPAHIQEPVRRLLVLVPPNEAVHEVIDSYPAEKALLFTRDDLHTRTARPVFGLGLNAKCRGGPEVRARHVQDACLLERLQQVHACCREEEKRRVCLKLGWDVRACMSNERFQVPGYPLQCPQMKIILDTQKKRPQGREGFGNLARE